MLKLNICFQFKIMSNIYNKILEHLLILICLSSFNGALIYRSYSLNTIGVASSIILTLICYIIILRIKQKFNKNSQVIELKGKISRTVLTLIFFYLLTTLFLLYSLFSAATKESIISPWEVVTPLFFVFYALATLLLLLIVNRSEKQPIALISWHYLISFSVALIIYKIGYGFDPFIHRATLEIIDKVGEVNPKPIYYLGQYSLTILIHKISFIPINYIDKLLVPVMAALFLPVTLLNVLNKHFEDKKTVSTIILALLFLPFSFFIVTTPQNFANLLLLITILRGLVCDNYYKLAVLYLLSLTALLTQPIAGIPALAFSVILTVHHSSSVISRKYLLIALNFGLAVALPMAFFLLNRLNGNTQETPADATSSFFSELFKGSVPHQENVFLNYAYLYGTNYKFLIILALLAGAMIAWKNKKECRDYFVYLSASASLFISYLLTTFLPFSFLISYERSNYTDRILNVAILFLLPFIILALVAFFTQLKNSSSAIRFTFITIISLFITSSLYFSYPRLDNYHNSHGYSVGDHDLEAVNWIENDTEKDFVVLANQQTSAAALYKFGFKKYYHKDIFYYPIPTGGQLYQHYLDMVYDNPSRETATKAMDLAGVDEVYFVLNKYWWASEKIAKEAVLTANSYEEIGNGDVMIYKYIR